jgi:hypothetical protein
MHHPYSAGQEENKYPQNVFSLYEIRNVSQASRPTHGSRADSKQVLIFNLHE